MKLEANELGQINLMLRISEEKNHQGQWVARTFDKSDELDALSIFKKLKACVQGEGEKAVFVESEVELSTAEKSLILKVLDRKHDIDALEIVVGLREKLK